MKFHVNSSNRNCAVPSGRKNMTSCLIEYCWFVIGLAAGFKHDNVHLGTKKRFGISWPAMRLPAF